jgi:7-keto-8-aminopelargonate synthetase-like enzyme
MHFSIFNKLTLIYNCSRGTKSRLNNKMVSLLSNDFLAMEKKELVLPVAIEKERKYHLARSLHLGSKHVLTTGVVDPSAKHEEKH